MRLVSAQRGASLLEALVALLIFACAILGVAGLMARAMQFTGDSQSRSTAVLLASSLLATMWGEEPGQLAARYESTGAGEGYRAFRQQVRRLIPGSLAHDPEVVISPSAVSSNGTDVAITISWRSLGNGDLHQHSTFATIAINE